LGDYGQNSKAVVIGVLMYSFIGLMYALFLGEKSFEAVLYVNEVVCLSPVCSHVSL